MPNLEKTCCEKCLGRGNPRIGDSYLACVDSDCPCHNPMQNPENPMQEPTKGWEDWGIELGELLDEQGVYTAFTYENGKALRNFISQLLANQKEEITEKIKGMKKMGGEFGFCEN